MVIHINMNLPWQMRMHQFEMQCSRFCCGPLLPRSPAAVDYNGQRQVLVPWNGLIWYGAKLHSIFNNIMSRKTFGAIEPDHRPACLTERMEQPNAILSHGLPLPRLAGPSL